MIDNKIKNKLPDLATILKKIEELKTSQAVDLSTEEDLSIGIMNLISIEEHLCFTSAKTGKDSYLGLLKEVREVRKELLGRMIPKHEGETWCISKHLLAASMRLFEVATKLNADGKQDEAKRIIDHGYKLYSFFWALRLKLINLSELGSLSEEEAKSEKSWGFEDIVNKLVDCCDE